MRDSEELPKQPSIFSFGCEVSTGAYSPELLPDEALFVKHPCENPFRKNIITCKDEYQSDFVNEVNGLSLDINLNSNIESLPFYIPIFNKDALKFPNLSAQFPLVGLTFNDILSNGVHFKAGGLHEDKNINFRLSLLQAYCFRNSSALLFSSGSDTLIEYLWYHRESIDLYEKVRRMGFWGMTGFNFSLINGECAFAQALNVKRSLYSSFEIEQSGLLTVPHVYALTSFQINRWIKWFEDNAGVKYFTTNCQLQNSKAEYSQLITSITEILKAIPQLHVILHGFQANYLKSFGSYLNRIHITEIQPIKQAQNYVMQRFDLDKHLLKYHTNSQLALPELIINNVRERCLYIDNIRKNFSDNISHLENITLSSLK